MIMKHFTKFQVFMIGHLRGEVSTRHFTLPPPWIHHNSETNYWILLSSQYALLLIPMKLCTKFQVSKISCLVGEMSTGFCDRQTDRQYKSSGGGRETTEPLYLLLHTTLLLESFHQYSAGP
jgi:hypothetical protein